MLTHICMRAYSHTRCMMLLDAWYGGQANDVSRDKILNINMYAYLCYGRTDYIHIIILYPWPAGLLGLVGLGWASI